MDFERQDRIKEIAKTKNYYCSLIMTIHDSQFRGNLIYKLALVEGVIDRVIASNTTSISRLFEVEPTALFFKEGYNCVERNYTIIAWYTTILMQLSDKLGLTDDMLFEYDKLRHMMKDPIGLFEYMVNNGLNNVNLYSCETYVLTYGLWKAYCEECGKMTNGDVDINKDNMFPISVNFMRLVLKSLVEKGDKDLFDCPIASLKEYCMLKVKKDTI